MARIENFSLVIGYGQFVLRRMHHKKRRGHYNFFEAFWRISHYFFEKLPDAIFLILPLFGVHITVQIIFPILVY